MQVDMRRVASCVGLVAAAVSVLAAPSAQAVTKANDVDRAFVREMIPHHQMAVEMAETAETQAEHAEIKTLATAIVDDQSAEIRTLRRAARRLGVTPVKMPSEGGMHSHEQMMRDAETLGISMDEMGMDMNMDMLEDAEPFDRSFIDMMVMHHQGAIRMARAERTRGRDAQLRKIARAIVVAQSKEIRQLNAWRKAWYGSTSPSGGVPQR